MKWQKPTYFEQPVPCFHMEPLRKKIHVSATSDKSGPRNKLIHPSPNFLLWGLAEDLGKLSIVLVSWHIALFFSRGHRFLSFDCCLFYNSLQVLPPHQTLCLDSEQYHCPMYPPDTSGSSDTRLWHRNPLDTWLWWRTRWTGELAERKIESDRNKVARESLHRMKWLKSRISTSTNSRLSSQMLPCNVHRYVGDVTPLHGRPEWSFVAPKYSCLAPNFWV